jgi:hypothetical protein
VWVEYIRPHIGNEENTPPPAPPAPPAPPSEPKPQGIWKEITGGFLYTVGESLFHMKEFSVNHMLYGATESRGKVVKFNGINWNVDFDTDSKGHGRWCNSYHLGEFGSFLYTGFRNFMDSPTSIRIYRTNGEIWSHVHQEPGAMQYRFIEDFYGKFITILSSYNPVWSKVYKKTNPNSRDIGELVKTYNSIWLYGDPVVHEGKILIGGIGIYEIDRGFNLTKKLDLLDPKTITSYSWIIIAYVYIIVLISSFCVR